MDRVIYRRHALKSKPLFFYLKEIDLNRTVVAYTRLCQAPGPARSARRSARNARLPASANHGEVGDRGFVHTIIAAPRVKTLIYKESVQEAAITLRLNRSHCHATEKHHSDHDLPSLTLPLRSRVRRNIRRYSHSPRSDRPSHRS